jgi:hypothetical protein
LGGCEPANSGRDFIGDLVWADICACGIAPVPHERRDEAHARFHHAVRVFNGIGGADGIVDLFAYAVVVARSGGILRRGRTLCDHWPEPDGARCTGAARPC